jgi:hypothetical protein
MPQAGFEPMISAYKRSRPTPQTARLLGLAKVIKAVPQNSYAGAEGRGCIAPTHSLPTH